MRAKYVAIGVVVGVLSSAVVVLAGSLDPPSGPTDAAGQMYTLEDIYNRLNNGAAGAKMTSFTEPSSGPGTGTMHSLDDIMGIAPAVDNASGAEPGDVLSGTTYWSLRTNSAWGPQTGTMPDNGAVVYTPGTTDQPVAAGYHNGSGYVVGDADLMAGNIKSGVDILGVAGTYPLAPVARTGVTETVASGDDGDLEKGVVWPNPRFTVHDSDTPGDTSDDTVTDNLTGLMWTRNANHGQKKWYDGSTHTYPALGYCNSMTLGGYDDWRLPNLRELHSLIDFSQTGPALPNGHPFTDAQSNYYWSSTTRAVSPEVYAWYVLLGDGRVYWNTRAQTYYVWPVRGGQ